MDEKMLARLGAILFVALVITATVIEITRPKPAPVDTGVPSAVAPAAVAPAADPLRAELTHCQLLGEAGANDPGCLKAWAENRRRFLAPDTRSPVAPATPEAR